jgi:hypothetical protein
MTGAEIGEKSGHPAARNSVRKKRRKLQAVIDFGSKIEIGR